MRRGGRLESAVVKEDPSGDMAGDARAAAVAVAEDDVVKACDEPFAAGGCVDFVSVMGSAPWG